MVLYPLLIMLFVEVWQEPALTAKQVVRKATDNVRGESSQSELIVRIVRPTWQREMTLKTWTQGDQYAMILVKSPVKDEGVAFLKRDKEVWNWVPVLERAIKLPPSMMTQSWMGTDFTNDDLVKESSMVEDYEHSFAGDTTIGNRDCYVIQMTPKPEAAIVWGKLILCIDKKDFLELHSKFYDEDGELINIMNSSAIKRMDGRLIPTYLEMVPAAKRNQKTVLIYTNISFNKSIPTSFFTLQQMKKLN